MHIIFFAGTLNSESGTVLVNSEANTMVESDLGTMVINESDEEDDGTMKSEYLYVDGVLLPHPLV